MGATAFCFPGSHYRETCADNDGPEVTCTKPCKQNFHDTDETFKFNVFVRTANFYSSKKTQAIRGKLLNLQHFMGD